MSERLARCLLLVVVLCSGLSAVTIAEESDREPELPNVLWICADDMSGWVGCYGDDTVPTPNIDMLANLGVKFESAFVPAPVCSAMRSALITGAMQTTNGLHHHRTMIKRALPDTVKTIPERMQDQGYITFNEAKDDYNFRLDRGQIYNSTVERPRIRSHFKGDASWLAGFKGKRFFGQIQLAGGKTGGETGSKFPTESRVDAAEVRVPPQYPDHPVMRNAIARHYEQIAVTDALVGEIINSLKQSGLWDNTVIIFFTDHGSPLPRAKQFVYEEGTRVPLIVCWPGNPAWTNSQKRVRTDLVNIIDVAGVTLGLGGGEIPSDIEAVDLFAKNFRPRPYVISARDRCGIAVDRIRSVRTENFRYIRNYLTDRALYQSNYRDKYATFKAMRELLMSEQLSPLQASYFDPGARPAEELYELGSDPNELKNLAKDAAYSGELIKHRAMLREWEAATGDQGARPEEQAALRLVYKQAKGKCPAPEFDFIRNEEK